MPVLCTFFRRRNNHMDRERLVPPTYRFRGPTMYCPPSNFLAIVFKKLEISQQVVTRMQDLASEFSKILGVIPPNPHIGRRRPLPHPTPSTAFGWARGVAPRCWDLNLGLPQLFSRGCAPSFFSAGSDHLVVPAIKLSVAGPSRMQNHIYGRVCQLSRCRVAAFVCCFFHTAYISYYCEQGRVDLVRLKPNP